MWCGHPTCLKNTTYGMAWTKKAEMREACFGRDGRRGQQEVRPPQLLETAVLRHGWHQKTRDVHGARFGRDGQRQEMLPPQLLETAAL